MRDHEHYQYGMIFMPILYCNAYSPVDIITHGYDTACRDILAKIAPDIMAQLAGASRDEQVEVDIQVAVRTKPTPERRTAGEGTNDGR